MLLPAELHTERRHRTPPLVVTGLLLIASVAVTGRSGMITGREGDIPPGLTVPVIALVVVAIIAAVVVMLARRLWRDGRCWAALAGTSLVLLGSGLGHRQRELGEFEWQSVGFRTPDERIWVHHGWTVEVWWPLIAVGLAVVIGAVAHAVVDPAKPYPSPLRALAGRLAGLAIASLVVFVALQSSRLDFTSVSGRPIRRRGRQLRARPDGKGTTAEPAELWRDAAVDEAEAVTSFVELGQRLEAVGAPSELVARCGRSASEEARHARVCTHLARRYGAADAEVPPAPNVGARIPKSSLGREVEVVRLALESFVDGVVGEGWAADLLAAGVPERGPEARLQHSLVGDERRHAELAADIVQWCVGRAPDTVVPALRRAVSKVPTDAPRRQEWSRIPAEELRSVGWVNEARATTLWDAHRAWALAWIDEVIASGGQERDEWGGSEPVSALESADRSS